MECPRCRLLNPDDAERCDCGYDFPSGEMKASYLTGADATGHPPGGEGSLRGIGGWLLLPAIGIVVSIPVGLFEAAKSYQSGDPGEAAVVSLALLLVAATAIAFFQRRKWAPRLFIFLLALNAILAAVPVLFAQGPVALDAGRDLGRATVTALIWIPYFLASKRVKATFA